MPRVDTSKQEDVKPYGETQNRNTMSFQERLAELFKAHEYVKVKNVDSQPFRWQYMPPEKEEYRYSEDGMHRQAYREEPEVWQLAPGETDVLVGANAYIMIEGLYKTLVAKKVTDDTTVQPGQARNFNFTDGSRQEYWIERIYLGKETPTFSSSVSEPQVEDEQVIPRRPGRPPRQTVES